MKKILLLTIILTTIWSCQSDRKFPEVTNLLEYKKTEFLPTLDNNISKDKNSVYCATLLFAWEKLRKSIKTSFEIDSQFTDLILFDKSKSNVLETEEYTANTKIEDEQISITAEFKKSLPFEFELKDFDDKLVFNGSKVESFGVICNEEDSYENMEVLYYKNDNDFVLKLFLRDREHEIILYKSDMKFETMTGIISEINRNIEKGKSEVYIDSLQWRYYLCDKDEVIIPKLRFNIEANFPKLENNSFKSGDQPYIIKTAQQTTAFLLDEKGAEIKSNSFFIVAKSAQITFDASKPKKLVFDKPFFLMCKRIDNVNPYFALLINNTELMIKK